ASLALSAYREGRYADAARFADRVPPGSPVYPRAHYLSGLVSQRSDPGKALGIFAAIGALEGDGYAGLAEVKQLAQLATGRTLFALGRYGEASAAYASVPRFSRHWDEALFEGAYADVRRGDPGAALGKLHSLRSPQLSDEYTPEAESRDAAGTLIRGRLAGLARLSDALDGDIEIVGFETLKGEKEFLEERIDLEALLAAQRLYRPALSGGGQEYWQFDGEYWPDE